MSDDELNAAVARIEGWTTLRVNNANRWLPPGQSPEFNILACDFLPPSYATDWRLCGPLIEKHGLTIRPDIQDSWEATAQGDTVWGNDITPQRAICRVLIAAHKEAA